MLARASVFMAIFLLSLNIKAEALHYVTSIDAFRLSSNNFLSLLTGISVTPLDTPASVASRGGLIYFYDAGLNEVYQYEQASQKAKPISTRLKKAVSGSRDLKLYVSDFQELFVLDTVGGHIMQYDVFGNLIQTYADRLNLNAPQAMCINPANRHRFIADKYYSHVIEFGVGGAPVALHGLRESGRTRAGAHIIDMACDDTSFYVLSSLDKEIKRFDYQGRLVENIKRTQVRHPAAIALDNKGRLYVADDFDDTIKIYLHGKYTQTFGGTGSGIGYFRQIKDLWFDELYLSVADSANGRIQVFQVDALPSQVEGK